METEKKITAAVAAVLHYIRTEEEAAHAQRALSGDALSESLPGMNYSPWRASGRQAQMQMRNLMQMRTFQRVIK
jgi:hypothetical protein